jgi:hypothetical protein
MAILMVPVICFLKPAVILAVQECQQREYRPQIESQTVSWNKKGIIIPETQP